MSSTQSPGHLPGLARALVDEKLIEESKAFEYLQAAKEKNTSLSQYLFDKKLLSPADVAVASSRNFGVPLFDLDSYDTDLIPNDLVNTKLIQRHQALPLFKRGNRLYLAVSDPSRQLVLDEIQFHTGLSTYCVVVENDKLIKLIDSVLNAKGSEALGDFLEDQSFDDIAITTDETEEEEGKESSDDAPIVRFVNKILLESIKKGASDIHFEPYEKFCRVRFRIDGMLHEIATPPQNLANRIASRLKIMSQLDISERRIPQDGRFMLKLSKRHTIDFRLSTCPTVNGEKVVMRILDPTSATLGIEKLGFSKKQQEIFLKIIEEPQGMVLVTGPTGSGKTVTLYTALNILNQPERNISTAEDPVEIKVPGINQVNINNKAGLTFSAALRSFLRQDPDIIMVGEMRDLETAEIGVKAAQTGHMVLSTLHTNSAPETLARLSNMGIAPYNIASSVSLIIAQRLARRLCSKCKKAIEIPPETLLLQGFQESELTSLTIFKAEGCEECTNGYKGRVGLYEVLPISKNLGEIIMRGGSSIDIAQAAIAEGMVTIRQSGLEQVRNGLTSLDEINRVTKD